MKLAQLLEQYADDIGVLQKLHFGKSFTCVIVFLKIHVRKILTYQITLTKIFIAFFLGLKNESVRDEGENSFPWKGICQAFQKTV